MSIEKTLYTKHRQAGVSLIELMISIVLGLLILAAATAMTVKSMVINADTLMSGKLNQDLDSVIQVMVNDIRRAGYSGGVGAMFLDNTGTPVYHDVFLDSGGSCVLYAYDANENDVLNDDEKYGFKLSTVGTRSEIQMRTSCTGANCPTTCSEGAWAALTDIDVIDVTGLTFNSLGSKCLSLTHPNNIEDPGGANPTNKNNFWVTTDVTTLFPCMVDSSTPSAELAKLTTSVPNSDEDAYESGTFVLPDSEDRLVGSRQVNVLITGELVNDDTMVKSQSVGINVRNYHIRTVP